jgi:hypothetical protein
MIFESPTAASLVPPGEKANDRTGFTKPANQVLALAYPKYRSGHCGLPGKEYNILPVSLLKT